MPIQDIKEGDKTPTQAPQEETNTLFQGRVNNKNHNILSFPFSIYLTILAPSY